MSQYKINLTLIKDFELSDKAVFAYIAILMTYQFGSYQTISPISMIKNIFGPKAIKIEILRQGIKELIKKRIIRVSYQEGRTVLYDLTRLEKYPCEKYLKSENSFFEKFDDLTSSVCKLYRLYLIIEHLINGEKAKSKEKILKTSRSALASHVNCERHAIPDRLKELQDLGLIKFGFINHEDYSDQFDSSFQKKNTLFISLQEVECEINQVIKEEVSKDVYSDKPKERLFVNENESSTTNDSKKIHKRKTSDEIIAKHLEGKKETKENDPLSTFKMFKNENSNSALQEDNVSTDDEENTTNVESFEWPEDE